MCEAQTVSFLKQSNAAKSAARVTEPNFHWRWPGRHNYLSDAKSSHSMLESRISWNVLFLRGLVKNRRDMTQTCCKGKTLTLT